MKPYLSSIRNFLRTSWPIAGLACLSITLNHFAYAQGAPVAADDCGQILIPQIEWPVKTNKITNIQEGSFGLPNSIFRSLPRSDAIPIASNSSASLRAYLLSDTYAAQARYPMANLIPNKDFAGGGWLDIFITKGADDFDEFPDCVCVVSNDFNIGSGVLIGPNVVLTAQHNGMVDGEIVVSVGRHWQSNTENYKIKEGMVIKMPGFDPITFQNDLSIIILPSHVSVNRKPIDSESLITRAQEVKVVGYGSNSYNGERGGGERRKVTIKVFRGDITPFGADPEREFVAYDNSYGGGRDSCRGDSGGPAYVLSSGNYRIAGIVSRRAVPLNTEKQRECGDGGIYVKITEDVWKWIEATAPPLGGILDPKSN